MNAGFIGRAGQGNGRGQRAGAGGRGEGRKTPINLKTLKPRAQNSENLFP